MKPITNIHILPLSLIAAAVLLVSCEQDELPGGNALPVGNALYISSALIGTVNGTATEVTIRPQTKTGTRAGSTLLTTGSIGVFRSQGIGYTETQDNKKYTYDVTKGWQPAAVADTVYLHGADADVCAYYPYNSAYTDKTAIPLVSGKYMGTADALSKHDPADLCYATNRALNGSQRATTFEMKHAMAMLELKISKEAGYIGDCRITSVSISNPELIESSAINITEGTYADPASSGVVKGTVTYPPGTDAGGILIGGTPTTIVTLLVPCKPTSAGLTIFFVLNGVRMEANIPTARIARLEAGKRYTVSVTMKANSMQVTGVDMIPWDEVGVGGDDYTWYPAAKAIGPHNALVRCVKNNPLTP